MNRFFLGLLGFLGVLSRLSWAADPEILKTGLAVMERNEERRRINDVYAEAVLTTGGGGAADRVKKFYWWKKISSDHVHYSILTRFHFPPEVRGEAILFLERTADENEVLMYLPNFKKVRRIESQQQSTGFMGSEFSYSDIATPHVSEYQYKLLKSEACPGSANQGMQCYQVEAFPASEVVKERIGYSKIVNWVRYDNFMVVQGEYYHLDGSLRKRMESTEFQKVDGQGQWKVVGPTHSGGKCPVRSFYLAAAQSSKGE